MRKVTTVEAVEALIGRTPQMVLLKVADALDDGCRSVLAHSPIAGIGFRDDAGVPHTTLVGGAPGFARVESSSRLSFAIPAGSPQPVLGTGLSMIFLLPGIGETLRLNGSAAEVSGGRVAVDVHETWVHCARCVLRSGLWKEASSTPSPAPTPPTPPSRNGDVPGPLGQPAVAEFLSRTPFLLVSSRDAEGRGDTSPKGDPPGFVRILDGHTLAIPDRRGNKRADTFRNLMTCDEVSLAALVPGGEDVLHMSGGAHVTDDPSLLATMALKGKPPHAALVVRVDQAVISPNEAVRMSGMWDRSSHVDRTRAPDLMHVAAQHLAHNKGQGASASMTRAVSKGLAASPGLVRRAIDAGYRKELKDEGY
ncbi:pyridoxamine 5'-phosphate oxidase family protein [Actinomadura sp. NAK00032]|uniref:pyridoxamine 5'-phosphate oxidase family protein n=1 Tax=Actinomadura sp. NAK00032 TaxID=2742128 RepID=UPI00158FC48A|nr:pyridoxamine 5'-phosphate oxidase family protein [Actinomadura sp. NAK00032]QKW38839.1 pyridoxamine 5'-phosphate oxidase family protein [Actinomadura sp. NAK00032]